MERSKLQEALERVKPGLSKNEVIEQATSFAFMGDRVVTYNDEISISHPVEGLDITGAVKAEELYQLLNKLKKDEITLEASENELLLTSGKVKAGLTFQQEISLPLEEVGEIGDWKKIPEGFCDALKFVVPTASRDMTRPAFSCVHVRKDGIIESSDGFRVTRMTIGKVGLPDCLIPAFVAKELTKYPITHQASGEGWRHFKTEDGTVFSCRILEEQFPDIDGKGILNVEGESLEFPATLSEALDRAGIFAKRDHYSEEEVTLTIGNKKILVEGQCDSGWFKESVNLRYTGEVISIIIHPDFLKDMLSKIQSCVIGEKSMKFAGENWEHVVWMKVGSK